MSDPAVEAAERVLEPVRPLGQVGKVGEALVRAAAREALAPIRELHRPYVRTGYPGADGRTVCNHCLGPVDWPCLTAGLVYTTEELSDE